MCSLSRCWKLYDQITGPQVKYYKGANLEDKKYVSPVVRIANLDYRKLCIIYECPNLSSKSEQMNWMTHEKAFFSTWIMFQKNILLGCLNWIILTSKFIAAKPAGKIFQSLVSMAMTKLLR